MARLQQRLQQQARAAFSLVGRGTPWPDQLEVVPRQPPTNGWDRPAAATAHGQRDVVVHCPGCHFSTVVTTRDWFEILDELHSMACDVDHICIDGGTIDDILSLPPQ